MNELEYAQTSLKYLDLEGEHMCGVGTSDLGM